MADSLTALLIDAKKEYIMRLHEIVAPPIGQYMQGLYRADTTADRYLLFQRHLSQIPFWNTYIIQDKTTEITRKFPYFENLMAACIVTQVKVLSSIRLSSDKPSIKLKLPTVDTFVHELYKQTAQTLYYCPTVMDCSIDKLNEVIAESIERAIRRLIPFDDILASYLQGGGDETSVSAPNLSDSSSSSSESSSDSESCDEMDDEPINVRVEEEHGHPAFPAAPQGVAPDIPGIFPSPTMAPAQQAPSPPMTSFEPEAAPPPLMTQPAAPAPPPPAAPVTQYPSPPVPGQLVPSAREAF